MGATIRKLKRTAVATTVSARLSNRARRATAKAAVAVSAVRAKRSITVAYLRPSTQWCRGARLEQSAFVGERIEAGFGCRESVSHRGAPPFDRGGDRKSRTQGESRIACARNEVCDAGSDSCHSRKAQHT